MHKGKTQQKHATYYMRIGNNQQTQQNQQKATKQNATNKMQQKQPTKKQRYNLGLSVG